MATPYPAPVSAHQVGSYFVQQYYQVLQQHPNYVHQFYTDGSSVVHVDGDSSETASALLEIHALVSSLNFTAIEVKTINSLESWNGGVLVVVSGVVKSKDFNGWRKFLQTFFLAPQEKGFFVLNDLFHFVHEEVQKNSAPVVSESKHDSQPTTSNPVLDRPVSEYDSQVETRGFMNSVRMDMDDPADEYILSDQHQQNEYGLQEQYQHEYALQDQYQEHEYVLQEQYNQHDYPFQEKHQQHEPEAEIVQEESQETPVEEQSDFSQNAVETVQEPLPPVEEPVGDLPKLSYASILRTSKGKPTPLVTTQTSSSKSVFPAPERSYAPAQLPVQQSNPESTFVQDHNPEMTEEGYLQDEEVESESKSVYVRNLSPAITTSDIFQEFKNFGRIKSDGVFIKNRKDVGVCYAFVEFEDFQSVQNAIKASPIQLAGRQVYIEGRRANNSSSTLRGGRRGRGRGGYQSEGQRGRLGTRPSGRGGYQDVGDNRFRGNGFRASQ